MTKIELRWPDTLSSADLEHMITSFASQLGIELRSRGTLKTLTGSIHIHFAKPMQIGTLELTILPDSRKAWLAWHAHRHGSWVDEVAENIRQQLAHFPR